MQQFQLFIPIDRRQAMAEGRTLPEWCEGAVLFADISGFTPLTDMLVQTLGTIRGAEELTEQLNRVYSKLVAIVHRYRGSVIGFSGDAITCWFDTAVSQTPPAARAVVCGLQMQATMQALNAQAQDSPLQIPPLEIKIGIATGQARRFTVGDPDHYLIDALAGSLMDEVSTAESLANRGDIIVDTNTATQLARHLTVSSWQQAENGQRFATIQHLDQPIAEDPWPDGPELSTAEALFKPWVLPSIHSHLQSGSTHFLTELRSSVALFLKFDGLEYDQDEQAGQKLDLFIRWVQAVLARYEGTLLQLTIGDKGSYLQIAFGAPIAHEDDPDRAVMAAANLLEPPPDLHYIQSIQIGISQGRMRVGTYGSPTRQVYGTLGNEVNMAARLMVQAKPWQTIVSERIVRNVNRPFRFQPLGNVEIKGKNELIPIYELTTAAAAGSSGPHMAGSGWHQETTIIGRQAEQAILNDRLAALKNGEGGVILIEGEPGIGKSQLAIKLFQQAQANGMPVLMGEADAIDRATPFYAWRPVFRQLFGLLDSTESNEAARAMVRQQLQSEPEMLDRLALLNVVLPLDFAETEMTAQMSSQVRGDNTNAMLLAILNKYLGETAVQPHLIIFEDAHWLDSASWTLLLLMQRSLPNLLLALTTRPFTDTIPSEYNLLRQLPNCQHFLLDTMPQAEIIQLVCQRLAVKSLPKPVIRLITSKAEGHPFFSEELAYALRDAGLLIVENGRCQLTDQAADLDYLDFPDTIEGIITSRIDRLAPSQQLVLKVASVIGRIFTMRVLGDVHPIENLRDRLMNDLGTLEKLDITPLESPEPNLAYYFKHIITRDVSYNLMTYAQRGQLHATLANWYEHHYQEDLSPFYALLAHHWYKALETDSSDETLRQKAIFYHEKAGDQALRNGVYREAIYFFETAISLAEEQAGLAAERRAYWLSQLGEAQLGMGQISNGRQSLVQALAGLGYHVPTGQVSLTAHTFKELARQVVHRWRRYHDSVGAGDTAVANPHPNAKREQILEVARTFELYGEASYLMGDIVALVHAMFSALNVAEKTAPSRESALANAYLVGIVGLFKRPHWVKGYRHRALNTAQITNHLPTIGRVRHIISVGNVGEGNWEQIKEDIAQAIDIYQHLGDRRQLGESLTVLILTHHYQTQYADSIAICEQLLTLSQQSDNAWQQMWAYNLHAMNLIQMGQLEEALATLAQVETLAIDDPEPNYRGLKTLALFQLGKLEEARRSADEAMAQMAQLSVLQISLLNAYSALAEVYLTLWAQATSKQDQAELRDLAVRACKQLQVYGSRFNSGMARAALWQGQLEWQNGRQGRALKQWQKSLAYAEQYAMPFDRALAHYFLSRHLETAVDATFHRQQAQAIFQQIGASYYLLQLATDR